MSTSCKILLLFLMLGNVRAWADDTDEPLKYGDAKVWDEVPKKSKDALTVLAKNTEKELEAKGPEYIKARMANRENPPWVYCPTNALGVKTECRSNRDLENIWKKVHTKFVAEEKERAKAPEEAKNTEPAPQEKPYKRSYNAGGSTKTAEAEEEPPTPINPPGHQGAGASSDERIKDDQARVTPNGKLNDLSKEVQAAIKDGELLAQRKAMKALWTELDKLDSSSKPPADDWIAGLKLDEKQEERLRGIHATMAKSDATPLKDVLEKQSKPETVASERTS